MVRSVRGFLLLLLVLVPAPAIHARNANIPGQFDYYAMALSWSPQYCAERPDDKLQCGIQQRRKLGFVLHGLWPQYNKGYPADCPGERFDSRLKTGFTALYPSDKLYYHEWEKHGTCSGLGQRDYLALSQKLKQLTRIPPAYRNPQESFHSTAGELIQAFGASNDNFAAKSVAVFCTGNKRFLREVLVCFDKKGEHSTACSPSLLRRAQKSCDKTGFSVKNIR